MIEYAFIGRGQDFQAADCALVPFRKSPHTLPSRRRLCIRCSFLPIKWFNTRKRQNAVHSSSFVCMNALFFWIESYECKKRATFTDCTVDAENIVCVCGKSRNVCEALSHACKFSLQLIEYQAWITPCLESTHALSNREVGRIYKWDGKEEKNSLCKYQHYQSKFNRRTTINQQIFSPIRMFFFSFTHFVDWFFSFRYRTHI